jgi:Ca2+-transporting ATPase
MQLFNEVNCRRLGRKFNIFKGIFQNWIFLGIWVGTVLAQILIVFFGGAAFNTTPISRSLWAASVGLGFVSIPLGFLIRLLPDWESQEPERVYMSRERLQWQAAAQEIRRGLSVFHALRRAHNNPTIS